MDRYHAIRTHVWVSWMMYIDADDIANVPAWQTLECERCGFAATPRDLEMGDVQACPAGVCND